MEARESVDEAVRKVPALLFLEVKDVLLGSS